MSDVYPVLAFESIAKLLQIDSELLPSAMQLHERHFDSVDAKDGVHKIVSFINNDYMVLD